jgi:hypothetical protein
VMIRGRVSVPKYRLRAPNLACVNHSLNRAQSLCTMWRTSGCATQ